MSLISPSTDLAAMDTVVPAALTLHWQLHEPNGAVRTLTWQLTRLAGDISRWDARCSGQTGPRTCRVIAEHDAALALLHLDSEDAGLLRVSLRLSSGSVRLLYARTALIEELPVPGGRAELSSPEVIWGRKA